MPDGELERLLEVVDRQQTAYVAATEVARAAQAVAERERTRDTVVVALRERKAATELGWQAFASAGEWIETQIASLWETYDHLQSVSESIATSEKNLGVSVGGVNRGKATAFVKRCKDQKHAIAFRPKRKR